MMGIFLQSDTSLSLDISLYLQMQFIISGIIVTHKTLKMFADINLDHSLIFNPFPLLNKLFLVLIIIQIFAGMRHMSVI